MIKAASPVGSAGSEARMALFRLSSSPDPAPFLRAEGIYLRPARSADFAPWVQLRSESRDFLTPWEPTWPSDDLTRAAFRRRLQRQRDEMARDEAFAFLIFGEATNDLLGGITIGGIRRGVGQAATLGYWMGAPHAGKGHMTRAVAAVVAFGFATLRLNRIEAACIPENHASAALLKRNCFTQEGFARAYLRINGVWRDHLLFGIVDGDAPAPPPSGRPSLG
jgi:ribosomal-protein-alanine N-acetyltransferase